MKRTRSLVLFLIVSAAAVVFVSAAAVVLAQDGPAVPVITGLLFPESPQWSSANNMLYFVEYSGNRVAAWDGQQVTTAIDTGEGSGPSGVIIDAGGNFWVTNYETHQVVQYSPTGETLTVIDHYNGAPLLGPNDLTMDAGGGIYFTDSGNFGDDWTYGYLVGSVYYYSPEGQLIQVDTGLRYPNGVALSLDGTTLYVDEHRQNQVLAYTINGDGTYSDETVFFRPDEACVADAAECYGLGPDGIERASDGTLYIAHYGGGKVMVVSPAGELIRTIMMPEGAAYPDNIGFNGDETAIYVSESGTGSIFEIPLNP